MDNKTNNLNNENELNDLNNNSNKNNEFTFTYSAPTNAERKEIESIRSGYLPKDNATIKLEKLRKLDGLVKNVPTSVSLAVGVIGTLIFGLGLTMFLEWNITIWGIIVSFIGVLPIALAYSIFKFLTNYLKNKYSSQILAISNELLNQGDDSNK